jgi:hypothetical protein
MGMTNTNTTPGMGPSDEERKTMMTMYGIIPSYMNNMPTTLANMYV